MLFLKFNNNMPYRDGYYGSDDYNRNNNQTGGSSAGGYRIKCAPSTTLARQVAISAIILSLVGFIINLITFCMNIHVGTIITLLISFVSMVLVIACSLMVLRGLRVKRPCLLVPM